MPFTLPLLLILFQCCSAQQKLQQQQAYGTLNSYLSFNNAPLLSNLTAQQIDIAQQINTTALYRQGIATVVNNRNVGDGSEMACGLSYLSPYFTKFFIGVGQQLYANGRSCSYCVRIYCVDTICEDPFLNNATFMITDLCDACKGNDIIISAPGMKNISGNTLNIDITPSIQVAYQPTSCADLIQGGIRMTTADELSSKYVALNFSNLKSPLKAVSINGLVMNLRRDGYWVIDNRSSNQDIPLRPPYVLELIGVGDGERLSVRIQSLVNQDLGVNFG